MQTSATKIWKTCENKKRVMAKSTAESTIIAPSGKVKVCSRSRQSPLPNIAVNKTPVRNYRNSTDYFTLVFTNHGILCYQLINVTGMSEFTLYDNLKVVWIKC